MAVQRHWTIQYVATPEPGDGCSQRQSGIDHSAGPGAGGRAKQAQAENGAAMGVDPRGGCEHGRFGIETDDSQAAHPATLGTGGRQSLEVRLDGCGADAERVGVHVVVTAAIDMAHEAGLGPRFQFQREGSERRSPR